MSDKPIFYDATGWRALGASVAGWTAGIFSLILGAAFVVTMINVPVLGTKTPFHFTPVSIADLEKDAKAPGLVRSAARSGAEAWAAREQHARELALRNERRLHGRPPLAAVLKPQGDRPLAAAFLPNWGYYDQDPRPALARALPKIDWLLPTWLALQGDDLTLNNMVDQGMLAEIRAKRPNLVIIPTLQNASNQKFNGPGLARLLADRDRSHALVQQLVAVIAANRFQGIAIDLEDVPAAAHPDLTRFMRDLSAAFVPHGWIIVMAVPFDDEDWPYKTYAQIADYTLLMAYDEHDDSGPAGSIAGQGWFETTLDKRMRDLAPSRTIVSIGSYAYDWNGGGTADALSFEGAVVAAHDAQAPIDFDDTSNNPHFSYIEDDQTRHDVWFLDGVTAYNQIHASDVYRPAGYALWRLGTEDPTVWNVMARPYGSSAPDSLKALPVAADMDYEGEGEFLRVDANPTDGARTLDIDPQTGDIDDETYTRLPTNFVIRQFGYVPKKIALTFDDGPDPEWTPQVLDILKQKGVKATFFVIGANAAAHPELVLRMVEEGHEVGNHTYTHPNLADTPAAGVPIELNATQRLFQALTGRSLVLFRPPYLGDAEPDDPSDMEPIEIAQNMGYITLGEHIDPIDWALPGVDQIVKRVLRPLDHPVPDERYANTVLLHDAGGDRSQTVAALPILIDQLRARGYQFVLAGDLIGMKRDQANPRLSPTLLLLSDRIVFTTVNWVGRFLYYAFLAAIWLGISRLLFLAGLSLVNTRRERALRAAPVEQPIHVSVIVPAYNEEKVIVQTVERLLGSDHRDLEVIVVDDGSQDRTMSVLEAAFGTNNRVRIITKPNGGKAAALNVGLARAVGEIIVALDADTQFQADTIPRLVRWFTDPAIGAVAGNAKVGNRTNMITRWQALEYIVAQNLE
ncbi:MAG: glycosyltransferase, partial [Alphaproteobacteria bacterium]|nr:glycosyltransferase [Alphaproteobacteria bacterium]